jgi:hypothetical protein
VSLSGTINAEEADKNNPNKGLKLSGTLKATDAAGVDLGDA